MRLDTYVFISAPVGLFDLGNWAGEEDRRRILMRTGY
jgi:hypothetical protein